MSTREVKTGPSICLFPLGPSLAKTNRMHQKRIQMDSSSMYSYKLHITHYKMNIKPVSITRGWKAVSTPIGVEPIPLSKEIAHWAFGVPTLFLSCMYVCMHACMHACIYVCMYIETKQNKKHVYKYQNLNTSIIKLNSDRYHRRLIHNCVLTVFHSLDKVALFKK